MNGDPRPELPSDKDLDDMCRQLAAAVEEHGLSVATAESLTAGNIAAHLGKARTPDRGFVVGSSRTPAR